MKFFQHKRKSGFTLIEMMVAVSIFSIVMVISMGALLNIININRKSQSVKTIMNNLSFALEEMAKNVRFGTSYGCLSSSSGVLSPSKGNCTGFAGLAFNFVDVRAGSETVSYFLAPKTASETTAGGCPSNTYTLYRAIYSNVSGSWFGTSNGVGVTAPEACITNLSFIVRGEISGDKIQPRVFLTFNGYAGVGATKTTFNLQTTVSQRQLDVGP